MGRIILAFLVVVICTSTPLLSQDRGSSNKLSKKEIRAAKKAEEKAAILNIIKSNKFKIEISKIFPLSSPAKVTTDGYFVELNDGKFSCMLPYYGSSKTAIMGGVSLSFESKNQKVSILQGEDPKSESFIYQFYFKNENLNDNWRCTIEVYDNGDANIRVDEGSRDAISYRGEMLVPMVK